ncbi:MAG TPA: cbb3-type cytochrome c oxidase subunit I [bacterium]|jgi:cytochrome c oxidase subunit 1
MTTLDTVHSGDLPSGNGRNYLNASSGFASWFFTLDHKRIALLYMASTVGALALGGLFAMLVRTELTSPNRVLMDAETYNKMFTLHGSIMIFLFIIPSIPAVFGNFALPLMIGAKDVAFPKLNLLSYHMYATGALLAVVSILLGPVDTGWTFYTPYSIKSQSSVIVIMLAVFILGFSSILTGLNFFVTIQKMRIKEMTWYKMPLFLWALYATAIIQIIATPVLGITVLLLIMDRLGFGIFNPALGGDPLLFQHFFWFYSHPAVYIMVLPGMGIMSELVTTFSRKTIFGYKTVAYSSIAIALISLLVWGHHLFVAGQSELVNIIFSFLTLFVAVPTAIKIFNWIATMYKGAIQLDTPMLFAMAFILLFTIGGLTGVMIAILSVDVHLHDTYFIVAHFHYTMLGGPLMAFFGGLHYWWPKMFGRMYNEAAGRISAVLIFLGMNITFFTMFIIGSQGQPRRTYTYDPGFTDLNRITTFGSYLIGIGFVIMVINLLNSLYSGKKTPANPWGSSSLEWQTSSPPPTENFTSPPKMREPYEYSDLEYIDDDIGFIVKNKD